jgi:hypothetical protein
LIVICFKRTLEIVDESGDRREVLVVEEESLWFDFDILSGDI